MKLVYTLATETQRAAFVERGETLKDEQHVPVDTDRLTAAHRAHLLAVTSNTHYPDQYTLAEYRIVRGYGDGKPQVQRDSWKRITLPELPEQLDGIALLEDDMQRRAAVLAELPAAIAAWETQRAADKAAKQRETAEQAEREAAAKAEQERQRADKAAWIQAHGSAYLQKAHAAGYDCQRRYVTERAAQEFPGYTADFDDHATWRSRSCPSEAALDEALRIGGEVVWLREPVEQNEDDYGFEPCEAVVKRGYLGRYDLVKTW